MVMNKKFADDLKTELLTVIGKAISETRQGLANDFLKAGKYPQKGAATCMQQSSESYGSCVSSQVSGER